MAITDSNKKVIVDILGVSGNIPNAQPSFTPEDLQSLLKTDPHARGVSKAMEEVGYSQTKEAIQMGVSPEEVLSKLISMKIATDRQQQTQQEQQSVPSQVQEQPQGQPVNTSFKRGGNFLFRPAETDPNTGTAYPAELLGGLISDNPSMMEKRLDVQLKAQKLAGKEPIQPEEQAKLEAAKSGKEAELMAKQAERVAKSKSEFFKAINEPLSTAKELSMLESAITGMDTVINMLDIKTDNNGVVSVGNRWLLSDNNFLSKNRQEIIRARDMYINKLLRRESGAVIGKEEEKSAKERLGFDVGLKSLFQNPKVIAKVLLETRAQSLQDRERLSPNERTRNLVQQLRGRNYTDPDIADALERRGIMSFE
jgi:hypothetical protein